MTKPKIEVINREHWLQNIAEAITPKIVKITSIDMPNFRVSVGWPTRGALSKKKRTIGQCWQGAVSEDGHSEIFISPLIADPMDVAGVVAHELVHANVGTEHGHRGPFPRTVRALGLEGKPTQTVVGPAFVEMFDEAVKKLGPYPHAKMNPKAKTKKQSTRMIKCECPDCGYIVRTSRRWIDEVGAPLCPADEVPMVVED